MKKLSDILSKLIYVFAAIPLLYLFINVIHYTYNLNLFWFVEDLSFMTEGPDSRLKNLIVILIAFVVYYLAAKLLFVGAKSKADRDKRVLICASVVSLLIFAGLVFFVLKTRIDIAFDPERVYERALSFAKGDYSPVSDYYIQMYPQQVGLAFFESIFLKFTESPLIFQILNAFFIAASVFLVYRLSHELTNNAEVSFVALFIVTFCFPLYYYVSFVYGDVFMICSMLFVAWALIKWINEQKIRYIVLILAAAAIMGPVRKNSLIFLIAVAIVFILTALRQKKANILIFAALALAIPIISTEGITKYYEIKGETKLDNGMPFVNWIAMGLCPAVNENCSVGVFNMFNEQLYINEGGKDPKLSAEASKAYIRQRFDDFRSEPGSGRAFFRFKILEQWAEPTFASIDSTTGDHEYCWEEVKFSYDFHTLDAMSKIMNRLQSIVYLFSFSYIVFALIKDKEYKPLILALGFLGGFLFSVIWEANGRYVFPYFILLIPLAGAAIGKAIGVLNEEFTKIKKSEKDEHPYQ